MELSLGRKYTYRLGARICLAGEGLGLYKGKAITLPIDCFSITLIVKRSHSSGFEIHSSQNEEELRKVISAVQQAFKTKDLFPNGFSLWIKANVPMGYGLASSATLYAVSVLAFNDVFGYNLNMDDIASIAYYAERTVNGVLVGKTDTRAVLYRKIMLQDNASTFDSFTKLKDCPDDLAFVVIGDKPSQYSHTGIKMKERFEAQEPGIMEYARNVARLVPELAEAWDAYDKERMALSIKLLFRSVCNDLKIGNSDYSRLIEIALSSGAYAAKNIGLRPSGGSIYAICDAERAQSVANAFKDDYPFVKIIHKQAIR